MSFDLLDQTMIFGAGLVVGCAVMYLWCGRPRPFRPEERYEPGPPHCQFRAVHECGCVLPIGHVEKHACVHGATWGAFEREDVTPPGGFR